MYVGVASAFNNNKDRLLCKMIATKVLSKRCRFRDIGSKIFHGCMHPLERYHHKKSDILLTHINLTARMNLTVKYIMTHQSHCKIYNDAPISLRCVSISGSLQAHITVALKRWYPFKRSVIKRACLILLLTYTLVYN